MENVRRSPSVSLAVGLNEYNWLTTALVVGEPEIVGGWLKGVGAGAAAVEAATGIENVGS